MRPRRGIDDIGIGVGIVIRDPDREGRILLSLRGPQANGDAGLWEFPGGAVEHGETLEQAVGREAMEELGIAVRILDDLGYTEYINPQKGCHWIGFTFLCAPLAEPRVCEPEKCAELRWCTRQEVLQLPLNYWARQDWERVEEALVARERFERWRHNSQDTVG